MPKAFGLSLARTQGVSMEPLIKQGDAVVIRAVSGDSIRDGDIVLYQRNARLFLHRVLAEHHDGSGELILVTKGDNLPGADDPVPASALRGKLVARLPLAGAASRALGQDDGYRTIGEAAWTVSLASVLAAGVFWLRVRRRTAPATAGATLVAAPEDAG